MLEDRIGAASNILGRGEYGQCAGESIEKYNPYAKRERYSARMDREKPTCLETT
jgi:hypothetical protein